MFSKKLRHSSDQKPYIGGLRELFDTPGELDGSFDAAVVSDEDGSMLGVDVSDAGAVLDCFSDIIEVAASSSLLCSSERPVAPRSGDAGLFLAVVILGLLGGSPSLLHVGMGVSEGVAEQGLVPRLPYPVDVLDEHMEVVMSMFSSLELPAEVSDKSPSDSIVKSIGECDCPVGCIGFGLGDVVEGVDEVVRVGQVVSGGTPGHGL